MQEYRSTNGRKSQLNVNANLRPIHNSLAKPEIELPESAEPRKHISLEDFRAYMPNHAYILVPTREMWPAKSVNARIAPISIKDASGRPVLDDEGKPKTMTASAWLDRHRPVEQMTWAPGVPDLIRGRLIFEGGWFDHGGATTFNLYRPPQRHYGDPNAAGLWISHVRKVFGANANHFNGFLKSVILRISEARHLGEVDRFKFYDHSKALTAAPPDVLRVNEKNLREHYVPNVTGVIITTNHKIDGIFLPADDRRHFVAWSELDREDFPEAYWNALWRWYLSGGLDHVAAYLRTLDLCLFDSKAPPPKTDAFWAIVDAHHAPEDAELADVLDSLARKIPGNDEQEWPDAVTVLDIANAATAAGGGFLTWITDRKNRRAIPHKMEQAGYVPVRNPGRKDGKWIINGSRQVAYGRRDLSIRDRILAAQCLAL
jgi:hypothetical protein